MVELHGRGFGIGTGHIRGNDAVTVQILAGNGLQHRLRLRVQLDEPPHRQHGVQGTQQVEGALNLLSALYTMLAVRRFVKLHPEAQSVLEAVTGKDLNGDGVIAPDVARADAEATAVELDHVDESAEVEQENDNEQIN